MRSFAIFSIILSVISLPMLSAAQTAATAGTPGSDYAALLERIKQLETKANRVDELEARIRLLEGHAPVAATTPAPAETAVTAPPAEAQPEATNLGPSLHLRAFGQLGFSGDDSKAGRPHYDIGNTTLLMTSRLSDKLSVLGELAFDSPDGDSFEVKLERLILQYAMNEHLQLSAGKYFTSIGYYNTAYYNADWAQTATTRPVVFRFADDGGGLPSQRMGFSATGLLSSRLGLHYVAEMGGGDLTRESLVGIPVLLQMRPGFNLGLFVKPSRVAGLQVGGSYYHDSVVPNIGGQDQPLLRQNIYAAYAVLQRPRWEWLNEAVLVRRTVAGTNTTFNTPGFYTLLSHKLNNHVRPYFRYDYVNASANDPIFFEVGRMNGPTAGLRYDFTEWIGVKGEYQRLSIGSINQNGGATQLVFTF